MIGKHCKQPVSCKTRLGLPTSLSSRLRNAFLMTRSGCVRQMKEVPASLQQCSFPWENSQDHAGHWFSGSSHPGLQGLSPGLKAARALRGTGKVQNLAKSIGMRWQIIPAFHMHLTIFYPCVAFAKSRSASSQLYHGPDKKRRHYLTRKCIPLLI